jgi:hypothetical protein
MPHPGPRHRHGDQPPPDPALPRKLTYVRVVSGPSAGMTARVPVEPDNQPVREVRLSGVLYALQRGPRGGWEYVEAEPAPPSVKVRGSGLPPSSN